MEVECWRTLPPDIGVSSRRISVDGEVSAQRPDLVIPFCCYVDIGVMTNVNKYPTSEVRQFCDWGTVVCPLAMCGVPAQEAAEWLSIVEDKDFIRSGGLTTPELVVTMRLVEPHRAVKRLERTTYSSGACLPLMNHCLDPASVNTPHPVLLPVLSVLVSNMPNLFDCNTFRDGVSSVADSPDSGAPPPARSSAPISPGATQV